MLTEVPRAFPSFPTMNRASTPTVLSRSRPDLHPRTHYKGVLLAPLTLAWRVASTLAKALVGLVLWLAFAAACVAAGGTIALIAFVLLALYAHLIRR